MARYSNVSTNFSGGLISDHLVGRIDLDRAANSSRKFTNFFPTVQGPAEYRPGFELVTKETDSAFENSVSAAIGLDENFIFRAVFGATKIKIFSNRGLLVDAVNSPYSNEELKDLRFSSETNKLYITHPNHMPRTLSGGLGYVGFELKDITGLKLITSDFLDLGTLVSYQGFGNWSLTELSAKVEPFLEPDTSDNVLRIEKGEEIVKIVSTDTGLQTIKDASTPTNYYIEYDLKGKTVLGKVITNSTNYSEVGVPTRTGAGTTADPYVFTIYVDAVDFVTDITAPNAKLFLLDNAETTNSSIQETILAQEGVPDGEVHLRTDVDIFNTSTVGTWIRVADDRRSNKVVLGEDSKFGLTRWVRISEYLGLETHPTTFFSGNQHIEETSQTNDYTVYDSGSVYKSFGDSSFDLVDIAETTAAQIRPDANRVFVWNGGEFKGEELLVFNADIARSSADLTFTVPLNHGIKVGDTVNISGLAVSSGSSPNGNQTVDVVTATTVVFNGITGLGADPTGDATLRITTHSNGTTSVVGNLTTAKSLEIVKCDSSLTVQEYNASSNTGGLLVKTTVAATVVTEVANEVTITSTLDIFDETTSTNRHIKGVLPSGTVYSKITKVLTSKTARASLNNVVPRDGASGGYENKGIFLEFSLGAWFPKNYPKAVAKYEQRRIFGGTYSNPNQLFFSRLNSEDDFSPTQDDSLVLDTDGISYGISNVNAAVTWLSAGSDLTIGTTHGVFKLVTNQFNAAVSPKTVRVELVDDIGCKKDGVLAGTSIFFPDESSTELLEYKFDSNIQSGTTDDVAKFIYPTFVRDTIKKIEYQNNPQDRLWVVTTSGLLYVLAYNRQESFYAWSKHETDGVVIDVSVLRKGFVSGVDQVWLTVKRGNEVSYERLFSEVDSINEPTYFLDNATAIDSYRLTPNSSAGALHITTADRTVGTVLSVVINDRYHGDFIVGTTPSGTGVSVPYSYVNGTVAVAYGTRYTGTLQMMYPNWNAQNKPAFGTEEVRIISQKVFTLESHKFKHGINNQYDTIKLPGNTFATTSPELGTLTKYTGFDRERPVRNSKFGVEKIPELVQDEPYKTIFGSLITKTDLN